MTASGRHAVSEAIVVDASAVITWLLDPFGAGAAVADRLQHSTVLAPQLLPFEVWQGLRRARASRGISAQVANRLHADFGALPVELWPTGVLSEGVWRHTQNLSAYDAAYVALAELANATLITSDGRLARAPGIRCSIEVVPAS